MLVSEDDAPPRRPVTPRGPVRIVEARPRAERIRLFSSSAILVTGSGTTGSGGGGGTAGALGVIKDMVHLF